VTRFNGIKIGYTTVPIVLQRSCRLFYPFFLF
jgi:hypothetical protein